MRKAAIFIPTCLVLSIGSQAQGDPLEDAYKLGYAKGYADASAVQVGTAGSTAIRGSEFETFIAPKSGTNFNIGNDSAVAIVPQDSLNAFKEKLGKDFMMNNKILLNQ
jgi:hypothetical protein